MLERSRFSDWIQFEAKLSTAPRHFFTGIFTGWIFGILSPLASPPPLPHPPPDDAKKSSDWPSSTNAPFYQFRPVKKVLRLNSDRVTYIVHTGHHTDGYHPRTRKAKRSINLFHFWFGNAENYMFFVVKFHGQEIILLTSISSNCPRRLPIIRPFNGKIFSEMQRAIRTECKIVVLV